MYDWNMDSNDLAKKPTLTVEEWLEELKKIKHAYDSREEQLAFALSYFGRSQDDVTLGEADRLRKEYLQKYQEFAFDLVRYVYNFWDKMVKAEKDVLFTAKMFTDGFQDILFDDGDFKCAFVSTKDYRYAAWNWQNANITRGEQCYWSVKENPDDKGIVIDSIKVHVTRWCRDHEDEWDFAIPVRFLDPNYDYTKDEDFMKTLGSTQVDSIYFDMFCRKKISYEKQVLDILKKYPSAMLELADLANIDANRYPLLGIVK